MLIKNSEPEFWNPRGLSLENFGTAGPGHEESLDRTFGDAPMSLNRP
jgi:hypothetical protein